MAHDDEAPRRTIQQTYELFINPEIQRRYAEGMIKELPFPLWAFQVLLPGDGSPTAIIRLNEEVRLIAAARLNQDMSVQAGTPVTREQITIESFELSEPEDLNHGHISGVWNVNGSMAFGFDFRRNKALASKLVLTAVEFLDAVRLAQNKSWSVFVDNLFSALELLVKAFLWTNPWGEKFKAKMPHTEIRRALKTFPAEVNGIGDTVWALEALAKERSTARYLHSEKVPRWDEGEQWLAAADKMLAAAKAAAGLSEEIGPVRMIVPVAPPKAADVP